MHFQERRKRRIVGKVLVPRDLQDQKEIPTCSIKILALRLLGTPGAAKGGHPKSAQEQRGRAPPLCPRDQQRGERFWRGPTRSGAEEQSVSLTLEGLGSTEYPLTPAVLGRDGLPTYSPGKASIKS